MSHDSLLFVVYRCCQNNIVSNYGDSLLNKISGTRGSSCPVSIVITLFSPRTEVPENNAATSHFIDIIISMLRPNRPIFDATKSWYYGRNQYVVDNIS